MTLEQSRDYWIERTAELRRLCDDGTAWSFLCASAVLDYLARMVCGKDRGGKGYVDFIRKYLGRIRPEYRLFTYWDGTCDLPEQMYAVLRCGIVHSFSFWPDERAIDNWSARVSSIALRHRKTGGTHLSLVHIPNRGSAALFIAEDFVEDIQAAVKLIFDEAAKDAEKRNRIEGWLAAHPPLGVVLTFGEWTRDPSRSGTPWLSDRQSGPQMTRLASVDSASEADAEE